MTDSDIAVVGLAAHLPGAPNAEAYWDNLRDGVESIRRLEEAELIEAGVSRGQFARPDYVRAAAVLDGVYDFDADFFGLSPKEAAIMDPQHRHFLMVAWEALEDAGHVPESFDGAIGVFAGCGMGSYFMHNLLSNEELVRDVGLFLLRHTGNDKDFLATRASYVFDLHGPSVNVQTACSTSLVATHLAVQHLLSGECDLALAGGVTIEIPHGRGYLYHEGEILSPDGHCRAFDHRSQGTVFGSGAGAVALRRLDDALEDGDQIYAVIKGAAVNNDGSRKVGYLAPSVDGQAACVAEAIAVAGVDAATLDYVECHGTGTPMGDPIEIAALSQAFDVPADTAACRIGSVKTNIGHLDTAAGVASLIKVCLAMRHGELPPSLNYESPNPDLSIESTHFAVNEKLRSWPRRGDHPRRAAVNSLGVGGTNAFAVLEQAPERRASSSADGPQLLVMSARHREALDAGGTRLAAHLRDHPDLELADVAWTLQVGRRRFPERRVLVASSRDEAIELLERGDRSRIHTHTASPSVRSVAFMFPGGGAQHHGMAADLAREEPTFARWVDEGLELLRTRHDLDLRAHIFAPVDGADEDELRLMSHQLPLIFIVEYALAQLLMSWDIRPSALVGHSLGENTPACVSGTISFEDCLGLVVLRGRLMDRVSGGAIAVPLPVEDLRDEVARRGLDIAVVNSPELTVVSGETAALESLASSLADDGVETLRVPVTTPVHSRLLEPVMDEFRDYLNGLSLSVPDIPWVSNTSGTWITDEQATDPEYWVQHLRRTVDFSGCIGTIAEGGERVLVEVGPGKTLSSLARAHPSLKSPQVAIPTMRHQDEDIDDNVVLLTALGRIWAAGGPLDTDRLFADGPGRRVSLPTYAFRNQTYFIAPGEGRSDTDEPLFVEREPDLDRWSWKPVWTSRDREESEPDRLDWLVLVDSGSIGNDVVAGLRGLGHRVVVVRTGDSYRAISDDEYVVSPELGVVGYESLVTDLTRTGRIPDRFVHLALLASDERDFRPGSSFFHRNQELGIQSVVGFMQAWSSVGVQHPLHISIATMGSQLAPGSSSVLYPEQSTVLGAVQVIPHEFADVTASAFDVDPAELVAGERPSVIDRFRHRRPLDVVAPTIVERILDEVTAAPSTDLVALRGDRRYVRDVRHVSLPTTGEMPLRNGGVVLITGGLGGIGLTIAETLHRSTGARIALMSRSAPPDRCELDALSERLGEGHPDVQRLRRLDALERCGAAVVHVVGDVTDPVSTTHALAEVRRRFGSLDGVVHAAGVVDDAPMISKALHELDDVLAPKVYGTLVLEQATAEDDLDIFVVFSSTSTVSAPIGQVDYVAANAFLNAFAESRAARGDVAVRAIDWGVWAGVGMAAEAAGRNGDAHDESVVTWDATHPLLDRVSRSVDGTVRVDATWSEHDTWMLDEHRTADGVAVVPGAAYPELIRAVLAELGVATPFELSDLTFLRPLAPAPGASITARLQLVPTESGYAFEALEQVQVEESDSEGVPGVERIAWRRTAEAEILLQPTGGVDPIDLEQLEAACPDRGALRNRQQDHLRFGPRWDVVRRVQYGDGRAVAWLELPEAAHSDLPAIGLHPALVDLGTGFAMGLVEGYTGDRLWVPLEYARLRVLGTLDRDIVAVVTVHPGSGEAHGFATFDVALCDRRGEVRLLVEGFTIKRLDGPLEVLTGRAVAQSPELVRERSESSSRHASLGELAFRHNLALGIRPEEGSELFDRALRTPDQPVLYLSSLDLHELRRQSDLVAESQLATGAGDGAVLFSRPQLDSEYLEPRDAVEEQLVGMWQDLLGVDRVGVQDDFFDLGGHSLIAVRLFSQVKRTFAVEFPISVLVEAPTVEAIARLVSSAMPSQDQPDRDGATIVAPAPRYRHLVPMHPGDGSDETPFFLVAGMFGNVLNLRHLAHQIGAERPFYGVQARGLYGDDPPHDDFVEMASDYLIEVRSAQPHGPYLLGGFSGGGIVAYEMAQQLRRDGEEVALLVMLDTPVPDNPPMRWRERVQIQTDHLRDRGIGYVRDWAVNRIAWEKERRRRAGTGEVPLDEGSLHSTVIEMAFYRALARYEVRPYDGVVHLFRPALTPLHVFGPDRQVDVNRRFIYDDNGWSPYCREVEVVEVPGDHDSMVLEPAVRVLAAGIRSALEEVERDLGPSHAVR